jgi:hypothetical protein
MRYTVRVDGVVAGSTTATSITVPIRVSKGWHQWTVTATNPTGQQSPGAKSKLLIDTVRPRVDFNMTGSLTAGSTVAINLHYSDRAPGVRYASGVGSVVVKWGDGRSSVVPVGQPRRFHVYARPGRYRVTAIVTDRAMNQTRRGQQVTIG